jgi:hypothetical protein
LASRILEYIFGHGFDLERSGLGLEGSDLGHGLEAGLGIEEWPWPVLGSYLSMHI